MIAKHTLNPELNLSWLIHCEQCCSCLSVSQGGLELQLILIEVLVVCACEDLIIARSTKAQSAPVI